MSSMEKKHSEVYNLLKNHPCMMRDKEVIKRNYPFMTEKLNKAFIDGCIGVDTVAVWWKTKNN